MSTSRVRRYWEQELFVFWTWLGTFLFVHCSFQVSCIDLQPASTPKTFFYHNSYPSLWLHLDRGTLPSKSGSPSFLSWIPSDLGQHLSFWQNRGLPQCWRNWFNGKMLKQLFEFEGAARCQEEMFPFPSSFWLWDMDCGRYPYYGLGALPSHCFLA